jgi:hypothetical protein
VSFLKPKSVSRRKRTAYHEAGHAVLSAAINDSPTHVSIRQDGDTLGHSGQKMLGRHEMRIQVHLAGYAAEDLLTGHRPRQFVQRLGFAILFATNPRLAASFEPALESTDEQKAVEDILAMGCRRDDSSIRREVDHFYGAAKDSLATIWPAVEAVAKAHQ